MQTLYYKTKQFFFVLIKLSIVVLTFYYIYYKLTNNTHLSFYDFIGFSTKNHVFSPINTLFLLFLTIFNWFLEILKWHLLVGSFKKISFKNALEQSLGALAASLFTPNRIGEYGAKATYYLKRYRKRVMFINFISNMMQMTITCIFGFIGLYFFINTFPLEINYYKMITILITGIIILLMLYYIIRKCSVTIRGFQIKKTLSFITQLSRNIILAGFALSITRYLIFSFQFYFLLHAFGIDIDYFHAISVITSMYLLASLMPSIFIFDVVIKSSVAVFLFSFLDIEPLPILCTVTYMWLLNFVFPSVFGSYYVLRFNFPKDVIKA